MSTQESAVSTQGNLSGRSFANMSLEDVLDELSELLFHYGIEAGSIFNCVNASKKVHRSHAEWVYCVYDEKTQREVIMPQSYIKIYAKLHIPKEGAEDKRRFHWEQVLSLLEHSGFTVLASHYSGYFLFIVRLG